MHSCALEFHYTYMRLLQPQIPYTVHVQYNIRVISSASTSTRIDEILLVPNRKTWLQCADRPKVHLLDCAALYCSVDCRVYSRIHLRHLALFLYALCIESSTQYCTVLYTHLAVECYTYCIQYYTL